MSGLAPNARRTSYRAGRRLRIPHTDLACAIDEGLNDGVSVHFSARNVRFDQLTTCRPRRGWVVACAQSDACFTDRRALQGNPALGANQENTLVRRIKTDRYTLCSCK